MPFYDYPNVSEKRIWAGVWGRVLLFVLAAMLVAGIVSVIVWAVSTGTAPVRGRSGAYQQQQSANNRVFQQANFEKLNADYQADLTTIQIDTKAAVNAQKANDVQLLGQVQTDLIGAEAHCAQIATTYNAQANSYLAKDFMTADLPLRLNGETCAQ